jgi:hypothetical protein
MAEQDWRAKLLEDLKEEGYIDVESAGILTEKDIRTAMAAIKQSEAGRDETEEWAHIRKLQRERAARMFGEAV